MSKPRKKYSEEEKKTKFGDRYDPNHNRKANHRKIREDRGPDNRKETDRNDWRTYALTEQIARDVGSFPYSDIPGAGKRLSIDRVSAANPPTTSTTNYLWNAQSVLKIGYINAQYANPADGSTGLQMAVNQLYTYIRHANSGAKNYEPADVMMYVLAMRDIYAEFSECKRAIGVVQFFSLENRNVPELLIAAMGINYADLIANIAQYRGRLNVLAKKINSFGIPKYFKAFDRMAFVTSNVFADSDSVRGQFFLYNRLYRYTFSGTTSTQGSTLIASSILGTDTTLTLGQRLDALYAMISAVENDTDTLTMSGDILHAFSDADLYQLSQTEEGYVVVPQFNEDASAQLENALAFKFAAGFTYGDSISYGDLNVTQADGLLKWQPTVQASSGGANLNLRSFLFNSHKDQPDFKDNLEWSRLISIAGDVTATGSPALKYTLKGCGLELVLEFILFSRNGTTIAKQELYQMTTAGNAQNTAAAVLKVMEYDWHPTVYNFTTTGSGAATTVTDLSIGADIKKYTWISSEIMTHVHDAANAAAFYADGLYNKG
nr:capsid protein [Rat picobirnavirus]